MQFIEEIFSIPKVEKMSLSGLTDELLCVYINKLMKQQTDNVLMVTSSLFEANQLYQLLIKYNSTTLLFPMDDFLASEAIAASPELETIRLETINTIIESPNKLLIITHLTGYLRYLPEPILWQKNIIRLKKKVEFPKEELLKKLFAIGYKREALVTKTGIMAVRGFIIDVFPVKNKEPIRIEFWGDTIETIRIFDLETQRSINEIIEITIYPFTEFMVEKTHEKIVKKQKYLPLYNQKINYIGGYLNNPVVVYLDYNQLKNGHLQLREEILEYQLSIKDNSKINYMHNFEDISPLKEIFVMTLDNVLPEKKLQFHNIYNSKNISLHDVNPNLFNECFSNYLKKGKTIILCLINDNQVQKLLRLLNQKYLLSNEHDIVKNTINIIKMDIDESFSIDEFIVISSSDLFKITKKRQTFKSDFRYGKKFNDITKLQVDEYVVHRDHGIGKYLGIATIKKDGIKKDYLQIEYKNGDKLYVPVERIDLIYKYSFNEGHFPVVNKLGGIEWQNNKARTKKKIKDIAEKLLSMSALREMKKGYSFSSDTEHQVIFENDFIYEATKDQLRAVEQIKVDMEKETPMDRLLCGDVGYGKTEVAFRAIFKAVSNSKQVCYLCPTTILSYQHFNNAIERFANFPVNIALLNRFVTEKETKKITKKLKEGSIDVIIGTHRLLSNDIKFRDLGLLVIDEEQRFGVTHKERIKEYKHNIDVLTLSATPIPRTLQFSISGIKDLSLIETPPMNRFPIQTYVLEQNDHIIKDAIYKELSRNGQVYFLYNKVNTIESKVAEISKLVPEARIIYAHGKMNKNEIESKMLSFINGEHDILVCTTIIETGIDISNVNTLIVIDADKFGLSQLYQIRGRVGRTNKIAYAYLMYKQNKVLTETATKRLRVIKDFTELGSGFSIALRDLSIRGSGDILGSEQAGFIDGVGIELYSKMLNEEIKRIQNKEDTKELLVPEKPLLNVETHIEENYVEEVELKIEIHQKINEIDSYVKLIKIKKELEDRFGKISQSMLIYMYQEWFEKMAAIVGIEKITQTIKFVELIFSQEASNNIELIKISKTLKKHNNLIEVSYQRKRLVLKLNIKKLPKHWIYYLVELLENITKEEC